VGAIPPPAHPEAAVARAALGGGDGQGAPSLSSLELPHSYVVAREGARELASCASCPAAPACAIGRECLDGANSCPGVPPSVT
jgi:hypothetical protein